MAVDPSEKTTDMGTETITDGKHMLLTTYRKNGAAVSSPVWTVAVSDGRVGMWTGLRRGVVEDPCQEPVDDPPDHTDKSPARTLQEGRSLRRSGDPHPCLSSPGVVGATGGSRSCTPGRF